MPHALDPQTLVSAYSQGYFPMPDPDNEEEIAWYFPDPRAILPLDSFHVSRSLRRTLNRHSFQVTFDQDFQRVMEGCAARPETWITEAFLEAYTRMHVLGLAHSVEVWHEDQLVGGVYGVSLRGAFFAESKFHRQTDASKVALYYLVERLKHHGFSLLEVQFLTPHLASLGAIEIPAKDYLSRLQEALKRSATFIS